MQATTVPTCRVLIIATNEKATINESDYNSELHKRLRPKIATEPATKKAPALSEFGEEDMSKLTIAALKELPEWALVRGQEKYTEKGAIIKALLKARARAQAAAEDDES